MQTIKTAAGALGFALAATLIVAAQAGTGQSTASPHAMFTPDTVKWGAAPPSLPPGAQASVLSGDPSKAGLFVIRLKFPDGYSVPPHSHPTDEHVLVVAGTLMAGMGDKRVESSMHALPAGGYVNMTKGTNHYVRAKGETIVHVTAMGPFEITYANPSDDPRKKSVQK